MLFDNLRNLFGSHFNVRNLVLARFENLDDGFVLAYSDTSRLRYGDLIGKPRRAYLFDEPVENGSGTRRDSARRHADDDSDIAAALAQDNFTLHLFAYGGKFSQ